MRTRRVFWLAGSGLLVLTVGWGFLACLAPRSNITRENFDRIQVGMTEGEVEQILGGPSGTYTNRRDILVIGEATMFRRTWMGDEELITIYLTLDEPRRVGDKAFDSLPPEPVLEKRPLILWW